MFSKLTRRTALALSMAVFAAPAMAAETIKAVVIDGYPARALWVKEFTDFFIPEVDPADKDGARKNRGVLPGNKTRNPPATGKTADVNTPFIEIKMPLGRVQRRRSRYSQRRRSS